MRNYRNGIVLPAEPLRWPQNLTWCPSRDTGLSASAQVPQVVRVTCGTRGTCAHLANFLLVPSLRVEFSVVGTGSTDCTGCGEPLSCFVLGLKPAVPNSYARASQPKNPSNFARRSSQRGDRAGLAAVYMGARGARPTTADKSAQPIVLTEQSWSPHKSVQRFREIWGNCCMPASGLSRARNRKAFDRAQAVRAEIRRVWHEQAIEYLRHFPHKHAPSGKSIHAGLSFKVSLCNVYWHMNVLRQEPED